MRTDDVGSRRADAVPKRVAPPGWLPPEYLRPIAVWSLIPSYLIAGGFLGYMADAWFHTFPYITGVGLILALIMATRDMLRLKDTM
jgi:hypothetical protein